MWAAESVFYEANNPKNENKEAAIDGVKGGRERRRKSLENRDGNGGGPRVDKDGQ